MTRLGCGLQLHEQGHRIIIATTRRGRPDSAQLAHETLAELKLPYDELHFGQASGDLRIGAAGVDAL